MFVHCTYVCPSLFIELFFFHLKTSVSCMFVFVFLSKEPEVFTGIDSLKIWRPRKYFKHFRDEGVLAELLLACRQLGKFGEYFLVLCFVEKPQ